MPDETDAKKILTASPLEKWRRPQGRSRTTWMRLSSRTWNPIIYPLKEAIDMAQNRPLWRLMSTFGGMHS